MKSFLLERFTARSCARTHVRNQYPVSKDLRSLQPPVANMAIVLVSCGVYHPNPSAWCQPLRPSASRASNCNLLGAGDKLVVFADCKWYIWFIKSHKCSFSMVTHSSWGFIWNYELKINWVLDVTRVKKLSSLSLRQSRHINVTTQWDDPVSN